MPDLFDEGPAEDEFSLPGDEAALARIQGARDAAPAPEVTGEPATAPETPAAAPAGPEAPAAAAEPETPAPVAGESETPALQLEDPDVQAYLEKFGGDPAKALRAAVEAQSLLGRQGQELGELRSLVEQGFQTLEARTAPEQPQYDPDQLEGWFADNPTRIPEIAAAAFYRGDETLMDQALVAWEEVDRAGARRFERNVAVARARAEVNQEQVERTTAAAGWNDVASSFAQEHPDLEQVAPKMREIATQFPNIVSVLQSGTTEAKKEVLEFLYDKASRGQETDTRARAREIAREQATEAELAIAEAAVASAATAVPANAGRVQDRIAEAWDKADAPYSDGWNV